MKTSKIILLFLLAATLAFFNSSCKKESSSTSNSNESWVSDDALAMKAFSDLEDISNEGMGKITKGILADSLYIGHCGTVSMDLVSIPIKLTIDFGMVNCVCPDTKSRRGKVIATFSTAYSDSGTVITITTENYFVNDNQVLGTETITNRGHNPAGHLHFGIIADGTIIKANSGGTITWHYAGDREWIAGQGTFSWWVDEYLVSGGSYGTAANGQSYSMTTTTPLDIKLDCRWITAGVLSVDAVGLSAITLDFGTGDCDNIVTLTYNGQSIAITMP